jgi:hypothetical protein
LSTIASQPPMIADELRRQADVFTDLVELQSKLGRDPSERPAPRDREARGPMPKFLQEPKETTLPARQLRIARIDGRTSIEQHHRHPCRQRRTETNS